MKIASVADLKIIGLTRPYSFYRRHVDRQVRPLCGRKIVGVAVATSRSLTVAM